MERSCLGSTSALSAKYMDLPSIQVEVNEESWLFGWYGAAQFLNIITFQSESSRRSGAS